VGDQRVSGHATIEGDEIVIRFVIPFLPLIFDGSPLGPEFKVTDPNTFASDVVYELNQQREDGYTPVHRMFDDAMTEAVEQGTEGVEEVADDDEGT
jgi:hypothetical protein